MKVAVLQMVSTPDVAENLRAAQQLVAQASSEGAELLVLPEYFCGMGWRDTDKLVYSTSLTEVSTARTRIERRFDPDRLRRLKEDSPLDLGIGGAELAAEAFRQHLVDECVLLVCPILLGAGKPALPRGMRLGLDLQGQSQFGNGVVGLHYSVRNQRTHG